MSVHNNSAYPSDFLDPKKKETTKIGLQYAKYIYGAYVNQTTQDNINEIIDNRKYSEGTYDISKFQNMLNSDEDMTALNLDWTPVSVIQKFVNVLVGMFTNQGYDIVIEGVDSMSQTKKDEYKKDILKKMFVRDNLQQEIVQLSKGSLSALNESEELPEDKQELEDYMELTYKQDLEIAHEKAVKYILEMNDYDNIEKKVIRDLIENKLGAVRVYYDGNNSIRIRYVDIANFVYTKTEDSQFKDCTYFGEVIFLTIQDIRRMNPDLTEEQLFDIAKQSNGKWGNRSWEYGNHYTYDDGTEYEWDDFRVQCLDFYVKTIDYTKFEKKNTQYGNFFINEKPLSYKPPKKSKSDRSIFNRSKETSYEGVFVTGTDMMVTWGKTKNMVSPVKDGEYTPYLLPQFIVMSPSRRSGKSRSLVSQMKPHSDKMMLANLAIQNLLANSAPSGLSVDISALNDLSIGNNKDLTPLEMIKLYRQTGVILYDGMSEDGTPRNMKPIEPLDGGVSSGIVNYIQIYQTELENIRNLTGLAPVDASSPQKNALIGVQKLAIQQSNNSTRELQQAFVDIFRRTGLKITRMIQDMAKHGGNVKIFQDVIGEYSTEMLGLHDDKTLAQLGLFVEALPTEEERHELGISIQKAVESGQISVADEISLKNIKNLKEAEAKLRRAIIDNEKAKAEQEQASYQAKAQADAMASQQSAQSKAMLEQMKVESEMKLEQMKAELKSQADEREFQYKKELAELNNLHKLEQIRASLAFNEEFADDSDKSLTKVSPSPPTKVTPPNNMAQPSKLRG